MFKLFCVTDRKLCGGDFMRQIESIAKVKPDAIILREKDLPESEYQSIARDVMRICESYGVNCILHSFTDVAIKLKSRGIHLPLKKLLDMSDEQKNCFDYIGASCHSVDDVIAAQKAGASYVTLGHIFATDCKKGLPPKGVELLQKACESVSLPIFAIGGIGERNVKEVQAAKASGACIMSGFMQCEDVEEYVKVLRRQIK